MHILVVDDDPLVGEMTLAMLEEAGHQVQLAEHGLDALERLGEDASIELVVSDLHMPLLNGLELFQELRERGLQQPFVLLTGDDPAPLLAREPGLSACLAKDASLEQRLSELLAQF